MPIAILIAVPAQRRGDGDGRREEERAVCSGAVANLWGARRACGRVVLREVQDPPRGAQAYSSARDTRLNTHQTRVARGEATVQRSAQPSAFKVLRFAWLGPRASHAGGYEAGDARH